MLETVWSKGNPMLTHLFNLTPIKEWLWQDRLFFLAFPHPASEAGSESGIRRSVRLRFSTSDSFQFENPG